MKVQDLEYALDLGKEIDDNFPRPDIDFEAFISCMESKGATIDSLLDYYMVGGSFDFSGSSSWYPTQYEQLYKKYADLAGIDWFILAAVHGKETSFSTNPVATDPFRDQ